MLMAVWIGRGPLFELRQRIEVPFDRALLRMFVGNEWALWHRNAMMPGY